MNVNEFGVCDIMNGYRLPKTPAPTKPAPGQPGTLREQLAIGFGQAEPRRSALARAAKLRAALELLTGPARLTESETAAALASIPAALSIHGQNALQAQYTDDTTRQVAEHDERIEVLEQVALRLVDPTHRRQVAQTTEVG